MNIIIDNYDFWNMESMKYYAPSTSWSPEKKKENAQMKIFSGEWLAARKRDGIWMMFIKDMEGNIYLRPRAKNTKGEFVNKIDWVPHLHNFFNEMDNGTVFLGELYAPWDEQAKTTTSIMNCLLPKALKRQEKEDKKLHYYIFDVLAENGKSYLNWPAKDRFDLLNSFWRAYGENYHEWAQYFYGQELWDNLQTILAEGGEGMVIINENSTYQPGKRSNSVSLKIKKELQDTVDCIMIGANAPTREYMGKEIEVWEYWFDNISNNRIKASEYFAEHHTSIYNLYVDGGPVVPVTKNWFYGWAGSWKLGAYKDGKIVQIGSLSGLTDEMKENWKDYVGKVCEVSAMETSENQEGGKGLRHPKLIRIVETDEKNQKDCTYERIFEK